MSDQPTGGRYAATIGEQLPAIQSLTALIGMLGSLPAAYITLHELFADRFDLQTDTPADFEVWREALQVPAEAVELHAYAGGSWLALRTVFHGTEVRVTSHGLYVGFEAAKVSPAEDAHKWECALAEQRHQVEDPAVPPLAAAGPVAPIEVRTLADMPGGAA